MVQRLSLIAEELEKKVEALMQKQCEMPYLPRPPKEPTVKETRLRPQVLSPEVVNQRSGRRVKGSCLMFNGKDSHVEIPRSDALDQSCDTLQADFWVVFTSTDTMSLIDCLFEYIKLSVTAADGKLFLNTEEGVERGGCGSQATSTRAINDGQWHSIHVEWQPKLLLKIDGVRQNLTLRQIQPVIRSRSSRGPEVMAIGAPLLRRQHSTDSPFQNMFKGSISELRLWGATPRGTGVIAKYSCDEGEGTMLHNLIDRRSTPATLHNVGWGDTCTFPDTVLELAGDGYVTGGTLGITDFNNFEVAISLCSNSSEQMAVLGVTDSQKKHQHIKLLLNTNEMEEYEPNTVMMSVRDAAGREHCSTCKADICNGAWNVLNWRINDSSFTLTVNGVETHPVEHVQQHPREYAALMDFLPIGAYNNRGVISKTFTGLLYDCKIRKDDTDVVHWKLTEGPGLTLLVDSTNNSKHAVYRVAVLSSFLEKSSASSAMFALVDKHSSMWHPYPRPEAAGESIILPNPKLDILVMSLSAAPRLTSPVVKKSKHYSLSRHSLASASRSVPGSKALTMQIVKLCYGGTTNAVDSMLKGLQKLDPHVASAAVKWAAQSAYCLSKPVPYPPAADVPSKASGDIMSEIDRLKKWNTPKGFLWRETQIDTVKHDFETFLRTREDEATSFIAPLYLMTCELVEEVVWGVWMEHDWVLLECWADLEATWNDGTLFKEVPRSFAQEMEGRGEAGIQGQILMDEEMPSVAGLSFLTTDSLVYLFRYSNAESELLKTAVAWVPEPGKRCEIPSNLLEFVWSRRPEERLEVDGWVCSPILNNATKQLLEECDGMENNVDISHHLSSKLETILEEGIPAEGIDSTALLSVTESNGPFTTAAVRGKLQLQRLEYNGSKYLLSLSGIPYFIDEETGAGSKLTRLSSPLNHQINTVMNSTLEHSFRGFLCATVNIDSTQASGEYTTEDPKTWYASHTHKDPVVFSQVTGVVGEEEFTTKYVKGEWKVLSERKSFKAKGVYELRGWLHHEVKCLIPFIDSALMSLPTPLKHPMLAGTMPATLHGIKEGVVKWVGYRPMGVSLQPSEQLSPLLSVVLKNHTARFIEKYSRAPRVMSWMTPLETSWMVEKEQEEYGDELFLRGITALEEFELYIKSEIARPEVAIEALDQLIHLAKRVVLARTMANETDVNEQLTWCLKEILSLEKPLIRLEAAPLIVERLLELGAERNGLDLLLRRKWSDTEGRPPVEYLDDVMVLLQCGARHIVNGERLYFAEPFSDFTPLHTAAAHDRSNYVDILCSGFGIDVDQLEQNGKTALHIAIESCAIKTAVSLLNNNANKNIPDLEGRLPLHYVALKSQYEYSEEGIHFVCLLASGTNLSAVDSHNLTPFQLAEERGLPAISGLLLAMSDPLSNY